MRKWLQSLALVAVIAGCGGQDAPSSGTAAPNESADGGSEVASSSFESEAPEVTESDRLGAVLAAQPEAVQARYDQRHPRETLEFFGIEPGMTVVEALPGGGWYSRILVPWLGGQGRLIGANYALDMWPLFPFGTDEFMAEMRAWPEQFPALAEQWCEADCAPVDTFWLGSLPDAMAGTADAMLMVRALHNLARFNADHGYLDAALADAFGVLKPGGVLGVVQHQARDDMPDDWAGGSNGYLKKQFVIEQIEAAGFEFVAESDINVNPNDRPGTEEYVWRLPPSLRLPPDAENPEALTAEYRAIGESHRMTLKFRKPR